MNFNEWIRKIKEKLTKKRILLIVTFVSLFLLYIVVLKLSMKLQFKEKEMSNYVPYNDFVEMLENKQVEFVVLRSSDSQIQFFPTAGYLKSKDIDPGSRYDQILSKLTSSKETSVSESELPADGKLKFVTENPDYPEFRSELLRKGIRVFGLKSSISVAYILLSVLQMLLPIFIIIGFLIYFQRGMEPKDADMVTDIPDTDFNNIAGYSTLKNDSKFILDFLKNPGRYTEIGARLPNGVIFYGPPGTGKTLMAKAIAGEANVPFFKANGSDFVELYVGLGARRVRKLYKTAKKNAPCIVFIDEIDSIGGARGQFRGSTEDDKTLTALLNELDGFSGNEGVITIAATNRLQDLDPALVRPGRFDRQLAVPLPDKEERLAILELYTKNKKISEEVSIQKLSEKTIGFSPSELENLLNEAAIKAVSKGHEQIKQEDIDDAYLRIIIKGDKKEPKEKNLEHDRIVAYHEAGHAIIGHVLGKPIIEVSIIPTTSGAGGYTLNQPKEGLQSRGDMKNEVRMLYGGRAAESIIAKNEDDVTTGAVSDIEQATEIISRIISTWGMNDSIINLNVLGMNEPSENYIEEAKKLAQELFEDSKEILLKHRTALDRLAERLIEKRIVDSKGFLDIFNETDIKESAVSQEIQDSKENLPLTEDTIA
ncbi:MAG: ATP-dependent metallopeptidase FtsH/Yme1/Tma family protein [Peptostreptococcaceae bacterium]|nr:ATP-dependent metallopeptidase FtsH/Yme1/Tma family protein [Peptostreptococcaceae bacterium]